MKTKYFFLFLSMMMPFVTMAQDDDDLYFVPSKKKVQTVQVITEARPVEDPYYVSEETDAAYTRDVDEYNRRGRYRKTSTTEGSGQTVDTLATVYSAGYAQGYGDAYSQGYTDGTYDAPIYRVRFTNIYDPFWCYDPWYYSSWYDPWYVSPWVYSWGGYYGWGYRPYYYGWGYSTWYHHRPYYYGGGYYPHHHGYSHGYRRGEGRPLYNGRTYAGRSHSNVSTGRYIGRGDRYVRGGSMGRTSARSINNGSRGRTMNNYNGRPAENGRSVSIPGNRSSNSSARPSGSTSRSLPSGTMGGGSRYSGGGNSGGGGRSMGGGGGRSMGGGARMGRGR